MSGMAGLGGTRGERTSQMAEMAMEMEVGVMVVVVVARMPAHVSGRGAEVSVLAGRAVEGVSAADP